MARAKRPAPDAFPHVVAFLRGYLHQDFAQEYGSAAEARDAFLEDCTPAERRAFREECVQLRRALSGLSLPEARRALAEGLGSAWRPVTRRDIDDTLVVPDDRR
jgi:hypothetical protein